MQIKVTGLKEAEAQLIKLGSREGTKVLRSAMMAAAKPIQDQAKINAGAIEHGSGALQKSVGRRFKIGQQLSFGALLPSMGGKFSVVIAPMKTSRVAIALYNLFYHTKRRGIFHGHFVEFGTRRSRKHPFLKAALDSKGPQAVESLASEIEKGVAKLLAKK